MAGDLKLTLRLEADGKGFVGEVRVAKKELRDLAGRSDRAGRATGRLSRATDRAGRSFLQAHRHHVAYLGGFGSIAGIVASARATVRLADTYTDLNNRLRLVTRSETARLQVRRQLVALRSIPAHTGEPLGGDAE